MIANEWASSGPLNLGLFINNQYVTVKKIGVGGFGTVWLAYDFSLRNFVAIKELLPEYAEAKFVEMFYKDALIAKNIIHDNVVRVQHFWQGSNGSFYIVLDYVRGLDLEVLLQKCREKNIIIPWKIATLICMNVLKAVDYANRIARDSITGVPYGIVYRDISPGNVLLSFDGNIKLSDFGVAKTADEIKNSIHERVVTGKYPYMSPEQVRGEADVDHRTDIFSIGSLYYEILTSEQLYQGTNEEIREQIINKPFDTAKILEITKSQEIADILSRALQKNRNDRYERAIEMYKDVRRVLRAFDPEDLAVELADFIVIAAKENILKSNKIVDAVKTLNVSDVKNDANVEQIQCNDFIVGQPIIGRQKPLKTEPEVIAESAVSVPVQQQQSQTFQTQNIQQQEIQPESKPEHETIPEKIQNESIPVQQQKFEENSIPQEHVQQIIEEKNIEQKEEVSVEINNTNEEKNIEVAPVATVTNAAIVANVTEPVSKDTQKTTEIKQEQKNTEQVQQPVISEPKQPEQQNNISATQQIKTENKPKVDILSQAKKPGNKVPPVIPVKKTVQVPKPQPRRQVQQPQQHSQPEAKGKTVFEEVGDWLFKKFDNMRKTIFRAIIVLLLAIIILLGLDVFLQITPFGKNIYAKLNPPDVVIVTTPEGALVSMKTKSGEVLLNNETANGEIPIRKVAPGSYIVTALKDGFKPVQRVVQIEPSEKSNKVKKERIEIMFDFVLNVTSTPEGASVYVDGNKFGVTPCNVQLVAAPHTIKLSLDGFADLGSNAKEAKAGQCNVDFSKSDKNEIFAGVDSKFWQYDLKNIDGEDIFCVSGSLFKQVEINSDPQGMSVHVQGESTPRGNTPLNTQFKLGKYNIKLLDPSGKYGEMSQELNVEKESEPKVFIKMDKIVTFNVRSKNRPNASFGTTVKISNDNFNVTKEVSSVKPLKIALPVEQYDVLFLGTKEYKPVSMRVDINNTSSVEGVMEYAKVPVTFTVKDSSSSVVLPNTFVWMGKTLLGKTDKQGLFKTTFLPGKYDFNFINKDYEQKPMSINVNPGGKQNFNVDMKLIVFEPEPQPIIDDVSVDTNTVKGNDIPEDLSSVEKETAADKAKKAKEEAKAKKIAEAKAKAEEKKRKKQQAQAETEDSEEQQVIVCPHCGYVNTAPISRKLRFCVNCAKPLK